MNLKRIAEDLDQLADAQSDKELDEALVACGLTADEDANAEDIFKDDPTADITASVKTAAEKDQFEVEGVNSEEQDEFTQVVGETENGGGQEDYSSVYNAAKKLASAARRLASVKAEIVKRGEVKRYAAKVVAMEKEIERRAEAIRQAVADKTPFPGDLGKTLPVEKEYGAYDTSEEAMNSEIQSSNHPWKGDAHDEGGHGIPKTEDEAIRKASVTAAVHKAVRLAVCLLGNKAPEDVIEAQGREFFASMDSKQIDNALRRFAETGDLYENKETCAAANEQPALEPNPATITETKVEQMASVEQTAATQEVKGEGTETPTVGDVKTVEQAANEVSASITASADAPFSPAEEAQIVAYVKARQAKIMAEVEKRIAAEAPALSPIVPEVAPEKAETPDEVKAAVEAPVVPEAPAPVEAPVEEAPAAEELPVELGDGDDIQINSGVNEADAVADPMLEAALDETLNPQFEASTKTAKTEKKPVQKLGYQKLASVADTDELAKCWANPDEEFFSK